jgi:transposase
METLEMIKRVRERKHELYISPNSPRPKKVRQVKSKVKSMLTIFFHMKEIVHKEFVLAGQTVNSAYYCDILQWLREKLAVSL